MKTYVLQKIPYAYPEDIVADGFMIQDKRYVFYRGNLWHGQGAQHYNGDFIYSIGCKEVYSISEKNDQPA